MARRFSRILTALRQNRARAALAVAMLMWGTLLACSTLWGFDDLSLLPPDASTDARMEAAPKQDAAPDTAADAAHEGPACVQALPPPPPSEDDDDAGDTDIIFAIRSIDLGLTQSAPVGFDLDTVCTCPGPSSCVLPSSSMDGEACDHPGGRDNATGPLIQDLGIVEPYLSQDALNADIEAGHFTFLGLVRDYNGQANDSKVTLEFFNSPGIDSEIEPPHWDGTDYWQLYYDNVLSGSNDKNYVSTFIDYNAYVTNYTLVGRLPSNMALRITPDTGGNMNYIELPTMSSVLTVELHELTGTFGARVPTNEFLSNIRVLQDDNTGQFLCGNDKIFAGARFLVCPAQDIMANPTSDNTGKPCDALSSAIAFTGVAAHLGSTASPQQVDASCPPDWNPTCADF
jgi:hypothetical protein